MKRIFFYFSLVFIFFNDVSVASEEAFFRPLKREIVELVEGDSFEGVIELWNIKNLSPQMIYSLVGKTVFDYFYVVDLKKPRWSENNLDLIVIEGTFILEKSVEKKNVVWKLGALQVPVTIKEISSTKLGNKTDKFAILNGEYDLSESSNLAYFVGIGLLCLLLLIILYFYTKKKKEVVLVKKEEDWYMLFSRAKTYEDFSYIYRNKATWLNQLKNENVSARDFLKACEQYLFKRNIEDFELEELKMTSGQVFKGMEK